MMRERLLKGISIFLLIFSIYISGEENLQFEGEALFSNIKLESASKFSQSLSDVPATISIIDSETIEKMGFKTIADILNFYSTSAATFYDRRYEFGIMRGFYEFSDYNSRFLILVDGVTVNEPSNNFAGLDRSLPIPIEAIERIEIIYGPFGVLYGTSNLGGVINIVTKKNMDFDTLSFKASIGSFNTKELLSSINLKNLLKSLEINGFLSFSLYESDGIKSGTKKRIVSPEEPWYQPQNRLYGGAWEERADFERSPSIFGKIEWKDFVFSGFWGYRKKGEPYAPWGDYYGVNENWVKDELSQFRGCYNHTYNPTTSLTLKMTYDDYSYLEHDFYKDDSLFKNSQYYYFIDNLKARRFSTELSFLFNYDKIKYLLGGYHKREKIFDVLFYNSVAPNPQNYLEAIHSLKQRATSTYGMIEYKPSEKLTSALALNYVKYSFTDGELLWRGSFISKFSEKVLSKLTIGKGFRVPTYYEYAYYDSISSLKNPTLKSEKSPSLELSFTITPTIQKYFVFTLFSQKIENFIKYKTIENINEIEGNVIPPNSNPQDYIGFQQYQNGGTIFIKGLSSSFNFVSKSGIRSYLNISYYDVYEKENLQKERKKGSPRWSGNCGILHEGEKSYFSLSLSYLGDFLTSEGHRLKPFKVTNSYDGRVNFGIKNFLKKNLTLNLLIINPFNFSGKVPLSSDFVPEIGKRNDRSFILTLKYTY